MVMVPPGMQYLYGSGEAAAASLQTYRALDTYLMARSSDRSIGHQVKSVVLAPGATLDAPKFADCGEKPLAVRSEEHTSELQSLMRTSYAVFCLNKKNTINRRYEQQTTEHQS